MKKVILISISIILITAGIFLYFNSAPSLMQSEHFIVESGESIHSAGKRLKKNNLISSEKFFKAISYLYRHKGIRIGKYKIYDGMTSIDIFKKLSSGDVITRKVTIPEGFNIYQIAERLESHDITSSGKFLYYSFNRDFLRTIKIHSPSAEGYLFPDTYVFPENSDARDIILFMHKKMRSVVRGIKGNLKSSQKMETQKLLTLASLVEKEAKVPSEREYISAVFQNRLRKNWRMDCDPTVRYAVKKFKGRITYSDLDSDSPYNTYRRKGLPPTPICSPGRKSIMAVLKPADTDYIFFVARNDGSHYFSKTLKEHNKAVRFYQRGESNGFVDNQKL